MHIDLYHNDAGVFLFPFTIPRLQTADDLKQDLILRRNDELKLHTLITVSAIRSRIGIFLCPRCDRSSFSKASELGMNQRTYAPGTLKQGFDREVMRGKAPRTKEGD